MSRPAAPSDPPGRTSAILLPSYAWNPYQRLLAAALAEQGVAARALGTWPRRAPILGAWWANGRPSVVHLHWIHEFLGGSRGLPSGRTVRWLDWQLRILKARGVRIVWTVHNLVGHEAEGADRDAEGARRDAEGARRDAQGHRHIIERADAIILHCAAARDGLIDLYRPSDAARRRMHVLPHGNYVPQYAVDLDRAQARADLDLTSAGPVFAFVGSIRGYKGVGELLEAFSGAADLGPEARLLVCGKPLPSRLGRELEQRAVLDPRIRLRLERIPEADLSRVLRASDAVVLPFRDILTSGSAILALSHGRPVIAPAMGCLPGTLPADATILYDPVAPGALATALRDAASADLAAMGLRARTFADSLDWGPIAAATARLYRGD